MLKIVNCYLSVQRLIDDFEPIVGEIYFFIDS